MATTKKKTSIDDYKDRMTCPFGAVRLDPKTNKPMKKTKKRGK